MPTHHLRQMYFVTLFSSIVVAQAGACSNVYTMTTSLQWNVNCDESPPMAVAVVGNGASKMTLQESYTYMQNPANYDIEIGRAHV